MRNGGSRLRNAWPRQGALSVNSNYTDCESLTRSLPLARPSRASGFAQIPFAASQAAQVDNYANLSFSFGMQIHHLPPQRDSTRQGAKYLKIRNVECRMRGAGAKSLTKFDQIWPSWTTFICFLWGAEFVSAFVSRPLSLATARQVCATRTSHKICNVIFWNPEKLYNSNRYLTCMDGWKARGSSKFQVPSPSSENTPGTGRCFGAPRETGAQVRVSPSGSNRSERAQPGEIRQFGRMPFGDTAGYQPALRQAGTKVAVWVRFMGRLLAVFHRRAESCLAETGPLRRRRGVVGNVKRSRAKRIGQF